ncbi:hypothetical protein [Parasitella parasitica]|uniref:PiggyBac transposable element-derived protein domain-containing protein n=1 Tax=Parasitella parasitica TaxID=35722 RepID=A0A0B7NMA3_9FUNG|nr:hypothetical protein [Parasitella parasitica]
MPRMSTKIAVDARISISYQHLRKSTVPKLLRVTHDFSAPGGFLEGVVIAMSNGADGKVMCNVKLDALPDHTFVFPGTTLKEEEGSSTSGSEDEAEEAEAEMIYMTITWIRSQVMVDTRNVNPSYPSEKAEFKLPNYLSASPAEYFLFFLPMDYIRDVVVPNINTHATSVSELWINVTFLEYMTWMALLMTMTAMVHIDKRDYWHKGSNPLFYPNINFSDYMDMDRFFKILKYHVFELFDAERKLADPLYQIRGFLSAFNETLSKALVPGKYLCIDESMNQWLGSGMPNVKKVPRKPHPIGQEFKTLADNHTYCILQLDTVSDKFLKEFDNEDRNLVATVKRLWKPWFRTGRTIIADSWFGSPEMTTKLLEQGLYSIMQVTKKAYWPRGKPAGESDVMRCLGSERGSFVSLAQRDEYGRVIFVCSYKDRKAKALISSCSTTTLCTRKDDRSAPPRPQVFEEYEVNKSSVDTNNNRRDDMISFHDVMKSYRWENRFLAFVFGIAEANAYSCFKI